MNKYKSHLVDGKRVYPKYFFRWRAMVQRCHNKKHPNFDRYGARGIQVCAEWRVYSVYHDWCEETQEEGKTVDRRDNDRGYSPDNCRWATPIEQSNNSRFTEKKKIACLNNAKILNKRRWGFDATRGDSE